MPSRTRKFRGLRTHGRGIKAGRGAGKQGGRGNAGLHKYKFKSMLIYAPDHFGRHGFHRPPGIVARPTSLNVGQLEAFAPVLEAAGALSRDGATYVADLSKVGVDRLLGSGRVQRPWKVVVAHASDHAREKVTVVAAEPAPADAPAAPKAI